MAVSSTYFEGVGQQVVMQAREDMADVGLREQIFDDLLKFDITCTFSPKKRPLNVTRILPG